MIDNMKSLKLLLVAALVLSVAATDAQSGKYQPIYYQRASLFEVLPVTPDDIVFLGNSITNGCEWSELFGSANVKNRGISGDFTERLLERIDPIVAGRPKKIFLMIGINDISRGRTVAEVVDGIARIVSRIRTESPDTKLYLQSLLPVTDYYGMFEGHTSRYRMVPEVNAELQRLAASTGAVYIDLYSAFADSDGKMKPEYTNDGLHLLGAGYLLWRDCLISYINE